MLNRQRRARLVVAAVALGAVLAGGAFATSDPLGSVFPWLVGRNGAPRLSSDTPQRLVSTQLTRGITLSGWSIRRTDGGVACLALRVTETPTGQTPPELGSAFANFGLDCGIGGRPHRPGGINFTLSWIPAGADLSDPHATSWRVVVDGRVPAGLAIERLALEGTADTIDVPLGQRFFVAVLPGTVTSQEVLPERGLMLVARRADGSPVARVDLDSFLAEASPPPTATP